MNPVSPSCILYTCMNSKRRDYKRCEIKTGKSNCSSVFFFILLCTYPVASAQRLSVWKDCFYVTHYNTHAYVFFLYMYFFSVPFRALGRETIRPRLFEPDKSHTEGVFFRGKKPKSRVVLHKTQVAGSIIYIRVCVNFNPALLLHQQQ